MAFDQKAYHKQWCKDNPDRLKDYRDRSRAKHPQKEDRQKNVARYRVYAYRRWDKTHGFTDTISRDFAIELMTKHCVWCHRIPAHGLDRLDHTKGHSIGNVVACCEKCNFILGDLPFAAKQCLKEGLIEIQKNHLLDLWEIPTKRKSTK